MRIFHTIFPIFVAAQFNDLEKGSIEIPVVGVDVFVTCGGTSMEVKVTKEYIDKNRQWLGAGQYMSIGIQSNLYRPEDNDPCMAKVDSAGNAVMRIEDDFLNCGMQIGHDLMTNEEGVEVVETYIFTNHILIQDGGDNFLVDRALDVLEWSCEYPSIQMATGAMNPLVKSAINKSKVKEIKGHMRLYKNENFTDFWHTPPELNLDDVLYVEVNLERPLVSTVALSNTEFSVVMEHCWGTPYNNREGQLKYYIIKDMCPVRGDPSLNVLSNGESLSARFDIKMFKFIGDDLNDVWLHCTVRACNQTSGNCVPDCDSRSRRSTIEEELSIVSLGHDISVDQPIQRKRAEGELREFGNELLDNASTWTLQRTIMVVIASVVVALVFVFGLTCMISRKTRGRK